MKLERVAQDSGSSSKKTCAVDSFSGNNQSSIMNDQSKHIHDVRASLAVINGFSLALDSAFKDLQQQYDELIVGDEDYSNSNAAAKLMALEADCRFCLSRLSSSVEQLKGRLELGKVGTDSAANDGEAS